MQYYPLSISVNFIIIIMNSIALVDKSRDFLHENNLRT
jgi:hypothetical protein